MIDISGFGTGIVIVALQSFPTGFSLSKFADDVDPLTSREIEPIGFDMLFDGDIVTYDKAAPVEVTVSVIPGSDDDINLKILLQNKKSAFSILPLPDITTMVVTYPDGGRVILTKGNITKGPVVDSISANGRRNSNTFTFMFGAFAGAQSAKQIFTGLLQGARELF